MNVTAVVLEMLTLINVLRYQGKGEMLTYWLVGEDEAKRIERLKEDSILFSDRKFIRLLTYPLLNYL